jgi:hypothetical protein
VRYRELVTQGEGSTRNSPGNESFVDVRRKSVVRTNISYRPDGVGTKFSTNDRDIRSYFDSSSGGRAMVMKSCSLMRGSRALRSIRSITPAFLSTYFPTALSTSKHPTSSTLTPLSGESHLRRICEESPPTRPACPLDEADWYALSTSPGSWRENLSLLCRSLIASFRGRWCEDGVVSGFFRRMVFLCGIGVCRL